MTSAPGPFAQSPVFDRAGRLAPKVRQSSSPLTVALALLGAGVVGVIVFSNMNGARHGRGPVLKPSAAAAEVRTPPPPAPVVVAAQPPAQTAPPTAPSAEADAVAQHLRAPAMIVDLTAAPPVTAPVAAAASPAAATLTATPAAPKIDDSKLSPDERFARNVADSEVDTARATRLRDLARIAPQGTLIAAVLETAISSDLPGSARAVVSRDVRGFDGSQVLIPRGSKLIGQYRSGVALGQTRAFVVWSRILTPDGVSIDIGSPATDQLGRGGLSGETNEHFFKRFGASILLSVMSAGLEAIQPRNTGGVNALVIGSPQQATNIASIALQRQIDIPVTITVPQGTPLQVFVTRDLDFSGVSAK